MNPNHQLIKRRKFQAASGWWFQQMKAVKQEPKREPLDSLSGRLLELAQAQEQERNGAR